jgi:hypothetical protein
LVFSKVKLETGLQIPAPDNAKWNGIPPNEFQQFLQRIKLNLPLPSHLFNHNQTLKPSENPESETIDDEEKYEIWQPEWNNWVPVQVPFNFQIDGVTVVQTLVLYNFNCKNNYIMAHFELFLL